VKLLSNVRVEAFRSIRSADIPDLGDFTALAGLNNSGKSNLLRALNAFFTGFTEPGQSLSLATDYHRPSLAKKRARRIRITVGFTLPPSFSFRKDLEQVEKLLKDREFTITKEWNRRQPEGSYLLNGTALSLDEEHKIGQFLQLINFRYIPNRVLPIDVIGSEHQALRDALIRRVAKRAKGSAEAFEAIRETSATMIEGIGDRLRVLHPDAEGVRLATPTSWSEMVFAFGYMLTQQGAELEDFLQGSGVQSVLMLETLLLIDQDYFQRFGWRQASVWGVEEPESSLHTSLEVQIAAFLASVASSPGRLQVLCTTHSDSMIQYADRPVFVSMGSDGTTFEAGAGTRSILERSANAGVSRWIHPILYYPLDPVILTEGKYDRVFLDEAFKFLRPQKSIRVVDLELLNDDATQGGIEHVIQYVRDNASAIKARSKDAPVVVLVDWDADSKLAQLKRPFGPDDPFAALAWPSSAFNPKLGPTFRGIERHYSDRLIAEAESRGADIARNNQGMCVATPQSYGETKRILHKIVAEGGLEPSDLDFSRVFLQDLVAACGA
jgi:hypothetical protein